jgi:CubicO group peptidase (beta-lactamase class C family)
MFKSISILLLSFACFFGSNVGANSEVDIKEAVHSIQKKYNVPAVGYVLIKNGRLAIGLLGVRDIETDEPVNVHSVFRLGSISKVFVGLAALKAEELGLINLEDKVSDYLGDNFLKNPWKIDSPVLVKHLLEHTAGLFDITETEFEHDSLTPVSLDEAFRLSPESREVKWRPGIQTSYSNIGAPIVAYIIEQVSGKKFEDFIDLHVLNELGMRNSSFLYNNYVATHIVSGHSRMGSRVIPYWHLVYRPFGALNASPDEMSQFLSMMINQGELGGANVFSKQQITRLQTPTSTVAAKSGLAYGYGLGVYTNLINGFRFFGHGGTAAGHLSDFRYSPELKSGYVVLVNANNSRAMNEITHLIGNHLTQGLSPLPHLSKSNISNDSQLPNDIYVVRSDTRNRSLYPFVQLLTAKKLRQVGNKFELSGGLFGDERSFYSSNKGHYAEKLGGVPSTAISEYDMTWYVQTPDTNYRQISALAYWSRMIFIGFILLSLVSIIVYSLFWIPSMALGRIKGRMNLTTRLMPLVCLIAMLLPLILSFAQINRVYMTYVFICMVLLSTAMIKFSLLRTSVSLLSKTLLILSTMSYWFIIVFLYYWELF